MTDRKIIITKGLPGSGKSTWAKKFARQHHTFKRINRDDLRAMIDDSEWSEGKEKFIREARNTLLLLAIQDGYSVILDETFLIPKAQNEIYELIQEIVATFDIDIDVTVKEFDTSVEECIKRDALRVGKARVGEAVIRNFYNKYVASSTKK